MWEVIGTHVPLHHHLSELFHTLLSFPLLILFLCCRSKVEKHGLDNDSSSSDSDSSDSSDVGAQRSAGVRTEEDLFAACGSRELRLFKQEGKAARFVFLIDAVLH